MQAKWLGDSLPANAQQGIRKSGFWTHGKGGEMIEARGFKPPVISYSNVRGQSADIRSCGLGKLPKLTPK